MATLGLACPACGTGTTPLALQQGLRKQARWARGLANACSQKWQLLFTMKPALRGASCFPRKFSLDDLLTIVMIYWTTGTITSSQRFYKENMGGSFLADKHHQ